MRRLLALTIATALIGAAVVSMASANQGRFSGTRAIGDDGRLHVTFKERSVGKQPVSYRLQADGLITWSLRRCVLRDTLVRRRVLERSLAARDDHARRRPDVRRADARDAARSDTQVPEKRTGRDPADRDVRDAVDSHHGDEQHRAGSHPPRHLAHVLDRLVRVASDVHRTAAATRTVRRAAGEARCPARAERMTGSRCRPSGLRRLRGLSAMVASEPGSEATLQGSLRVRDLLPQIPDLRRKDGPAWIRTRARRIMSPLL